MQRPLVMDWREDAKTRNRLDEFMFGPAILVNPVLEQAATHRDVYLPQAARWYDFWTGDSVAGGQTIRAEAPLDTMPLFIRAGSILPLGPEIEYADQKPAGLIELRIYTGADGSFDLYQDEGDNYDYEKGAHAIIPIKWSEKTKTLTVGDRAGTYPGMPAEMNFRVVLVSKGHGTGEGVEAKSGSSLVYKGNSVSITER
jgi:alpha-D-xyloside xylohydrolase